MLMSLINLSELHTSEKSINNTKTVMDKMDMFNNDLENMISKLGKHEILDPHELTNVYTKNSIDGNIKKKEPELVFGVDR